MSTCDQRTLVTKEPVATFKWKAYLCIKGKKCYIKYTLNIGTIVGVGQIGNCYLTHTYMVDQLG